MPLHINILGKIKWTFLLAQYFPSLRKIKVRKEKDWIDGCYTKKEAYYFSVKSRIGQRPLWVGENCQPMPVRLILKRLLNITGRVSCLLICQKSHPKKIRNTRMGSVRYYWRCVNQISIRIIRWNHFLFIGCLFLQIKMD